MPLFSGKCSTRMLAHRKGSHGINFDFALAKIDCVVHGTIRPKLNKHAACKSVCLPKKSQRRTGTLAAETAELDDS